MNLSKFATSSVTCAHCKHIKPCQIPGRLYRVYKIRQTQCKKKKRRVGGECGIKRSVSRCNRFACLLAIYQRRPKPTVQAASVASATCKQRRRREREERGKKKADSRQTKTQDTEETRDNERQCHQQQQQQPKQHRHWQQHRCLLPLPPPSLSPFRSP